MIQRKRATLFIFLAVGLGIVSALALGELLARIRVEFVWPAEKKQRMLSTGSVRGRYVYHPELGYVPRPDYDDHNSLGFRGPEFEAEKRRGVWRIVCLGGSSTYGRTASSAYPAVLEKLLRDEGIEAEVINAGVPGWTSRESRLNFELRVRALDPDLVVIYHGRNDLMPQAYHRYQNDYSHFRDPTHDFRAAPISRASVRRAFAFSHLFMLVAKALPRLTGLDLAPGHPIYGAVRVENRPDPSEVPGNLAQPGRGSGFHDNTEAIVQSALTSGAQVLLATFAFLPERLVTGHFLREDPILYEPLAAQLHRNNEVLRTLAGEHGLFLAETDVLVDHPEIFIDDCHVGPRGHALRARVLLEALRAGGAISARTALDFEGSPGKG